MSEGHAKLSPSAAHRWLVCPGSVALCADSVKRDSAESREGTFAHDIAAQVLLQDRDRVAELLGKTDGEFTLDAEMAQHVQAYVSAVRTQVMLTEGELLVEHRVYLTAQLWGTADALVWSYGALDVFDLKFGRGVFVDVVDNEQEMIYALAALSSHPEKVRHYNVETVRLHIVQPRRPDAEGLVHRTWETALEALLRWKREVLEPGVEAVSSPESKLSPGDHCRFCDAKPGCPALMDRALASASAVFPQVDPLTTTMSPPEPKQLTAEQLAFAIQNAEIVETWLKAVRKHATERARGGEAIPGWKLVQVTGNRRWKDEAAAEQTLRAAGVNPTVQKLASPNALEEQYGKSVKPLIATLTERRASGITLARENDKRPAIQLGGEGAAFDVIE